MSYKTYITDALVCGSRQENTSDKSFLLFTREAGMLFARAKSVREERSKQRFALQEFSLLRVSLVHGKTGWRITGAEPLTNIYALQQSREARALVRNVIRLMRRLVQGEVPHSELFDELVEVLSVTPETGKEQILEEVFTLRTLYALGYIAPPVELRELFEAPSTYTALSGVNGATASLRKTLIEQSLKESHL